MRPPRWPEGVNHCVGQVGSRPAIRYDIPTLSWGWGELKTLSPRAGQLTEWIDVFKVELRCSAEGGEREEGRVRQEEECQKVARGEARKEGPSSVCLALETKRSEVWQVRRMLSREHSLLSSARQLSSIDYLCPVLPSPACHFHFSLSFSIPHRDALLPSAPPFIPPPTPPTPFPSSYHLFHPAVQPFPTSSPALPLPRPSPLASSSSFLLQRPSPPGMDERPHFPEGSGQDGADLLEHALEGALCPLAPLHLFIFVHKFMSHPLPPFTSFPPTCTSSFSFD